MPRRLPNDRETLERIAAEEEQKLTLYFNRLCRATRQISKSRAKIRRVRDKLNETDWPEESVFLGPLD